VFDQGLFILKFSCEILKLREETIHARHTKPHEEKVLLFRVVRV